LATTTQLPLQWFVDDDESEALFWLLYPELLTAAQVGGTTALLELAAAGFPMLSIDWAKANTRAAAWAEQYAAQLVKQITETTREQLRLAVSAYQATPGMTRGQLEQLILNGPDGIKDLHLPSGRIIPATRRAEMIAVTETTRSVAEGEIANIEATGVEYTKPKYELPAHVFCRCWFTWRPRLDGVLAPIWNTRADEIAGRCPVCGPRHLQDVGEDSKPKNQQPEQKQDNG
jgi:hypothetical protein